MPAIKKKNVIIRQITLNIAIKFRNPIFGIVLGRW